MKKIKNAINEELTIDSSGDQSDESYQDLSIYFLFNLYFNNSLILWMFKATKISIILSIKP